MIHQLDNRMKVIRLREAVFSVPLTNFDKLVGPTFTQCQCVLPTLRRRITYQKSTIRRVDHLLVHLVPSDVSPIPFCLLECAWSFRRNENTAKYSSDHKYTSLYRIRMNGRLPVGLLLRLFAL